MKFKRLSIPIIILIILYILAAFIMSGQIQKQGEEALLVSQLSSYTDVVERGYESGTLAQTLKLIPSDLRVTILDELGNVIFDSDVTAVDEMDSHQARPEIQSAHYKGEGTHMRRSATTDTEYLYYARLVGDHYVRTALPHTPAEITPIRISKYFNILSVIVVLMIALRLYVVSRRSEETITQFKKLSKDIAEGVPSQALSFPADELGDISKQLMVIVEQKEESRKDIEEAREHLIRHFKLSNIGIAIFNTDGEPKFANSHFIQFANMLASEPMTDVSELLDDPRMVTIKRFLSDHYDPDSDSIATTIQQNSNIFEVKALRSGKDSYEITIANITEQEKSRRLKQEMTGNITHEIRTPLTSIRGYLETLKFMHLSEEKRSEFLDKAYCQSVRLSEMMDNIRLISKLDEDAGPFEFEEVDLHLTAEEVRIAYQDKIAENQSRFINKIPEHLTIQGNASLLYSILQNLVENSLRYGGSGTDLVLECYHQDESYIYLSYHDTGKGLAEQHMNRIFERFYRADAGRTRAGGGSGLGLSIVKNAIHLHSGQVQARTHSSGGLEILFTLHK